MSNHLPSCPSCEADYTYESGALLTCPMCDYEWLPASDKDTDTSQEQDGNEAIKDSVGNVLTDGDSVSVIKTLKVKGGGGKVIKIGTRVSGIRLIPDGVDGHDIDAKVPGFGQMQLKSSVVRKLG